MAKKSSSVVIKSLKLPPAVGDWTRLKQSELEAATPGREYLARLSGGQLDKLHLWHYQLGSQLETKLTSLLEQPLLLDSVLAEQIKYRSFAAGVNQALVEASVKTSRGEIIFCLDQGLAEFLIDSALGGRPRDLSDPLVLTDIEKAVLSEILREMLSVYINVFGQVLPVSGDFQNIIADGPRNSAFSEEDFLFLISLVFYLGENQRGRLFLGYSEEVIKPLLDSLGQMNNNVPRQVLLNENTLAGILVPVKSELGATTLTTGELAKIRLGDVVSLEKKAGSPVYVIVGDKVPLRSQVGVYHGRLALQLSGGVERTAIFGQSNKEPVSDEIRQKFSENINQEVKEGGQEMASEKYFDSEVSDYDLADDQKVVVDDDRTEYFDEPVVKADDKYTEEADAEEYGFSLDEE